MHLNFDCHQVICDFLDTFDLLSLVQVNRNLFTVVEEVLRRRFIKKWLVFRSPYNDFDPNFATAYGEEFENRIEIQDLQTVHTIIRTFGHLISKLMIAYEYVLPDSQSRPIYQAVNLHCSESLRKFHIVVKNGDIFSDFTIPFKNVEKVTLNGIFVNWGSSRLTFNELFPSIKRLNIESAKIEHVDAFNQSLPHLEELFTDTMANVSQLTRRLIQDNPQILRLSMVCAQPDVLQLVADKLPLLEHLMLEYYHEYKVDGNFSFNFNFQHLKSLILRGSTMPTNITLGNIEDLEISGESHQNAEWIDLVVQHNSTLKKLDFLSTLKDSEVMELANAHLNVVTLRFIYSHATSIESLLELIKSCEQLKRLELYVSPDELRASTFDALKNQLREKWTVHMAGDYLYLDHN